MIRIHKSPNTPVILSGQGATATAALNKAYSDDPALYTSAAGVSNKTLTKMPFDSDIYGAPTVKQQLIDDQHGKCCFCEADFSENSYGDVEHFRPKGAYKKRGDTRLTYPGYYWLAYDWQNLMFSCEKCNRSFKGNQFPLANEATRKPYHDHANLLANEDRLLIDPNSEDPSTFMTFKEEVPVPVTGSIKGATSIKAFNLERMNNMRLDYLLLLKSVLVFTRIDLADEAQISLTMESLNLTRQEVIDFVNTGHHFANIVAKDNAKFALCVRCKFPELPTA